MPLIWLSAPPGYGKTTAIASYLHATARSHIWYQCDAGDADIASFFYHLKIARELYAAGPAVMLPTFLPEHYGAIPTFARNFFRALFASFESGATLVFDNFQDIPADAALMQLLTLLADEIPANVQIIFMSRTDPVPALSRLIAGNQLAVLRSEELELSRAETENVIAAVGVKPRAEPWWTTDELYTLSQGWPAGLTLLLRLDPKIVGRMDSGAPASQTVFDYFASEVYSRLSEASQEFLLDTSCLEPIAVSVAERLTGRTDSRSILERLVHENVFTTYRPAADTYQYHPLFRSYLLGLARQRKGVAFQRAHLVRAARALAECGDLEPGISLLHQAESWDAAADLIESVAADLVRQARIQTLARWIQAIPRPVVEQRAWLVYWHGICQFMTSFVEARENLERAYAAFCRDRVPLGQMLACSAILRHINYCYADYRPMFPWIARLSELLKADPVFPSAALELQIAAGYLASISVAVPDHPDLLPLIDRVMELTSGTVDVASRAAGISALQHFFCGVGRTAQYGNLDRRIAEILEDPQLAPVSRVQILWLQSYQHYLSGDAPLARQILSDAAQIAAHHGLVGESQRLRICQLQAGDPSRSGSDIARELAAFEPMARMLPPIARAQFLYVRAMHELSLNHAHDALQLVMESIPLIDGAHWPLGSALAKLGAAEILCELGRYDEALRYAAVARDCAAGLEAPVLEFNVLLVEAAVAGRIEPPSIYAAALERALKLGRQQGYANGFHDGSRLLRRLIPDALRLGIEVSYCRSVIVKHGWAPPAHGRIHWPWPVRIRAFGTLTIELNDVPLQMAGKVPRKPLELLKLLLINRRGIDAVAAMDLLWPEMEGDAARNAFDIAAHRLRKLLRCNEAVLSVQGTLVLNPDRVWVDVFEIARLLDGDAGDIDDAERAKLALQLYRARFLCTDSTPWVSDARVRLHGEFLRLAKRLIDKFAVESDWRSQREFCEALVTIESGDEAIYRAWIHSLVALDLEAEAQLAYLQCEDMLSKRFGRTPSASTKKLLRPGPPTAAVGRN